MPAAKRPAPAKTEAVGEAVTFDYDGLTFTVPPASEWDLDVLESYEDGKIVATLRALLGADQWSKFKATKRTVQDLNDLFEAVQEALGISGN